jgi:hypothetical protein
MILFFAVCTFALVQCNTPYKKAEVFEVLEQIVEHKYGGDQKRSKCMMKHMKDKTKHKNLAVNVSRTLETEEFEALMKPFIDVALYDCTGKSFTNFQFLFHPNNLFLCSLLLVHIFHFCNFFPRLDLFLNILGALHLP